MLCNDPLLSRDASLHPRGVAIQGWTKSLGQILVMKLPPQRGEGKKREGVNILELSTQNLWPKDYVHPVKGIPQMSGCRGSVEISVISIYHIAQGDIYSHIRSQYAPTEWYLPETKTNHYLFITDGPLCGFSTLFLSTSRKSTNAIRRTDGRTI